MICSDDDTRYLKVPVEWSGFMSSLDARDCEKLATKSGAALGQARLSTKNLMLSSGRDDCLDYSGQPDEQWNKLTCRADFIDIVNFVPSQCQFNSEDGIDNAHCSRAQK